MKRTCSLNDEQQKQKSEVVVLLAPPTIRIARESASEPNELSLEDLPDELILKILSKLDYRFHNRIRCASRGLNRIYTQHMLHCFRANSHLSRIQCDVDKELNVTYDILNVATRYYVESGYESPFCGALSTLFKRLHSCPDTPHNEKVISFLRHFFNVVETRTNQETISPLVRLVYILTFMSVLRKFRNFRLVKSRRQGMHWQFEIELRGVFLGILWWKERQVRIYPRKRTELLSIICELAHVHLMNVPLQRIWENANVVYLYGHTRAPHRPRAPQTTFNFMVYAHDSIVQLLRSVLELNVPAKLPRCLPKSPFIVNVSIVSGKALAWGCRQTIDLQIGPLSLGNCESDNDCDLISDSDTC